MRADPTIGTAFVLMEEGIVPGSEDYFDKLDARIYLAAVLTHIANHVMDEGDAQAWRLVSDRQKEFFSELSQEERDEGHRVIREPKGEVLSEPPCDEATIWVIRPRWIRLRP